ncbi:hypothetical protein [Amycolatopsis sp. NPDC059657]|uniref:hypothetical protein n=1 Tax=Amycolatopsis sp. NPDC059657 TaxID=3346899 RepID=UPI00366BFB85
MRGIRWTIYIAAGLLIVSSLSLLAWSMVWGMLCDPMNTFVRCEREFAFRWDWLIVPIPIPFAIYSILAVRRSTQAVDALVSGVLLLALGVGVWLAAWLVAAGSR